VVNSRPSGTASPDAPVAIVTGAAQDVGRDIALFLAGRGYDLVVQHNASSVEAQQVVRELSQLGRRGVAVAADLREPQAAASAVFEAAQSLGSVSVVINNAVVCQDRALAWIDSYHCRTHLSVNLLAPVFLAQQLVRHLPADRSGQVINLLDSRAEHPGPTHLMFTASRAALVSVTRSLALQLAPTIRVNGIVPGRAPIPASPKRVRSLDRLCRTIGFLLDTESITGDILHVSDFQGR